MTKFVLVRHGQSLGNFCNKFVGRTDVPLTDLGRKQAERTGKYLEDTLFDRAFSSPLLRAKETGEIVLGKRDLPLVLDREFQEINGGLWENREVRDLEENDREGFYIWRNDFGHAKPPQGETPVELSRRVQKELHRLALIYPGKTLLVASHATPIRMLRVASLGLPPEEAQKVQWPSNASVSRFLSDGKNLVCESYDESEHLGEFCTRLAQNK